MSTNDGQQTENLAREVPRRGSHDALDLHESHPVDDASGRARTARVLQRSAGLHLQYPSRARQLLRGLSAVPAGRSDGWEEQPAAGLEFSSPDGADHRQAVS